MIRLRRASRIAALLFGVVLAPGGASAADPDFGPGQVVFQSDKFGCEKIPAIAGNGAGVLVAAVEQRFGVRRYIPFEEIERQRAVPRDVSRDKFGCADYGFANIVLRRSTDDGATWEKLRLLVDLRKFAENPKDKVFAGNPTLTWIPRKNRFVLLFVVSRSDGPDNSASCVMEQEKPNARCETGPAELDAYAIASDDLGLTWSEPKIIPKDPGLPPLFRPGPGHGSVLASGRVVVPAYPKLMLSDDDGETWRFGADNRRPALAGSETALAPLPDGRVWSLVRLSTRDLTRLAKKEGTPLWLMSAASADGGQSYQEIEPTRRFPIPVIHTSMLLAKLKDGKPVVVISGPAVRTPIDTVSVHGERRDMMVAIGDGPDDDRFEAAVVHEGPAGYSDLVALAPGKIGILYEGTDADDDILKDRSYVRKTLFKQIDLSAIATCGGPSAPTLPEPKAAESECFRF